MNKYIIAVLMLFVFCAMPCDFALCYEDNDGESWSDSYIMGGWVIEPYYLGFAGILVGYEYDWHPNIMLMLSPEVTLVSDDEIEDIAIFVGGTASLTLGPRDSQFFLGGGAVYGIEIKSGSSYLLYPKEANVTWKGKIGYNGAGFKIYLFINGVYSFGSGFFGLCVSIGI